MHTRSFRVLASVALKIMIATISFPLFGEAAEKKMSAIPGIGKDDRIVKTTDRYLIVEKKARRDQLNIYGRLYVPTDRPEKLPMVIISHGFGGNISYTEAYAEFFAEAGVAAYVFDFCGGGPASKSDGSPLDMSVRTEVSDLSAVLSMVKQLTFVDNKNLFLMGESQGGLVTALAGAEYATEIRGLILLYPAFVIQDDFKKRGPGSKPIQRSVFGIPIGERYIRDAQNLDIYNEIGEFSGKILIIHGDQDTIVPLSYSQKAVNVYHEAELVVLPGAGHGFNNPHLENAGQLSVQFVRKLLR